MADESRATPAELNERQKKFADYVIKLGRRNAKEAAEIAGYSKKTAGVQANQLLKNLKIKAYIDLSGYTAGTYEVEVKLETDDSRFTLVSTSSKVNIKIAKK